VPTTIAVPPDRAAVARAVAEALTPGLRVALTTHVNADGDGIGSEVALWHLLTARGLVPVIANPTPVPTRFGFLMPAGADRSAQAAREIERADVLIVLDISDLGRLGDLGRAVSKRRGATVCVDHHVSPGTLPDGPRLLAPEASATAELVYDLAAAAEWDIPADAARGLYVGILADTGGFRFANTTPRVLRIAANLLELGVHAEAVYQNFYANASEGRVRLTAEVLDTLVVESDVGLAWVTVPTDALERHGVTADDLEGITEFPRSVAGVRLALMFRPLANGRVKVSFRSVGAVDVAQLAHQFGGGGHTKAAGASVEGAMGSVQEAVLAAARRCLSENGAPPAGGPGG
jgi:phosphoesterase RecJ-like protein